MVLRSIGAMGKKKKLPNTTRTADRNMILKMRNEGKTYAEIAEKLGISRQRAHQQFKKVWKEEQAKLAQGWMK